MVFRLIAVLIFINVSVWGTVNIGTPLKVGADDMFQRLLAEGNNVNVIEEKELDGIKGYCVSYEPETVQRKSTRRHIWIWVPAGNAFYLDNLNYGLFFFQGGGLVHHKSVLEGFETHLYEALHNGIFVFHIDYSVGQGDLQYPVQIREWLLALTYIKKNFRLENVGLAGESAGAEACSMLFSRFNFDDYSVAHKEGVAKRSFVPVVMAGDEYASSEEHILLVKDQERSKPFIKGISVLAMPSDMTLLDPVEFDFEPYFGVKRPEEEVLRKYSSLTYYSKDNRLFSYSGLGIQTFHGVKDKLVPVQSARNFYEYLMGKDFPVTYVEMEADHSMSGNFDKGEVVHMNQFSFLRRHIFPEFQHETFTLKIKKSRTLIYEYLNVRLNGINFKGKVRVYRYNSKGIVCIFSGVLKNDYFDDSYINMNLEDETRYIVTKVQLVDGKEVESRY